MNADREAMPLDKIDSTALIERKAAELFQFCKGLGVELISCGCCHGITVAHVNEKDGKASIDEFEKRFENG